MDSNDFQLHMVKIKTCTSLSPDSDTLVYCYCCEHNLLDRWKYALHTMGSLLLSYSSSHYEHEINGAIPDWQSFLFHWRAVFYINLVTWRVTVCGQCGAQFPVMFSWTVYTSFVFLPQKSLAKCALKDLFSSVSKRRFMLLDLVPCDRSIDGDENYDYKA